MQDAYFIFELLGMLFFDVRMAVLLAALVAASVIDIKTYRIPNWLTLSGIVFALAYSAILATPGRGILWAAQGMVIGFLMTVPFYVLRVMGAGDVKLMAMIGAFIGAPLVVYAGLYAFCIGGVAAILFALRRRAMIRMLKNIKDIGQLGVLSVAAGMMPNVQVPQQASIGRLPFGVSISIGTVGYLIAWQLGFA